MPLSQPLPFIANGALLVLAWTALGATATHPHDWTPSISLTDDSGEPGRNGFCPDIAGVGTGLSCDRLRAHTCKPEGDDTQFGYDAAAQVIYSFHYLALASCRLLPAAAAGMGGCMTALDDSRDGMDGAFLKLSLCDGSPSQKFTYTDNGQFQMTSLDGSDDIYCLSVGSEVGPATGGYYARDLLLADCDATDLSLTQWTVDNDNSGFVLAEEDMMEEEKMDDDDDDISDMMTMTNATNTTNTTNMTNSTADTVVNDDMMIDAVEAFGQMFALDTTEIELSYLGLPGTIPTELGLLTALTVLDIQRNTLNGTLPSELGILTLLTEVNLFFNSLSGSLPPELGMLTALSTLSIHSNSFTGTLPSELGLMSTLHTLTLNDNSFSGIVPAELGLLTKLTILTLSSSALTGAIPSEIGLMLAMGHLDFEDNSLVGTIPTELGSLAVLNYLSIHENALNGTVPISLCLMTPKVRVKIDCEQVVCPADNCTCFCS